MNYMLKDLPKNHGTWSNSTLTVPERITALLREFLTLSVPNYIPPNEVILQTIDPDIFRKLQCNIECTENIKLGFEDDGNLHIYVNSFKKIQPKSLTKGKWQFWESEINIFLEQIN